MAVPVPTVALISGGKDSFFSLLHSNANGFQVIALANLHPPILALQTSDADTSDDLNSFMYQTVGHTVLPHYSSILNIPLYRAPITGSSVNQDLSYHPNSTNPGSGGERNDEEDEIENLYSLLSLIKAKHPELKAVSSGAILSSYQRTRVESVCQRLGLISVAWIWQRKQERVLQEMEAVGLDARIIKVASLGLNERWLGRSVADYKTRMLLEGIKKKYGGNVAGEGGEFETLVMGCKGWNKRIEVVKSEVVDEGGDVAWTRFLETKIVELDDEEIEEMTMPKKPPILDKEFEKVLDGLMDLKAENLDQTEMRPLTHDPPTSPFRMTIQLSPQNVYITNLHSVSGGIIDQVSSIFSQLQDHLSQSNLTLRHITSTLLLLRSIDDFQIINGVYSSYFAEFPNPPSRVCVAIGDAMPENIGVLLSVAGDIPEQGDTRKALHVQSRSYWAPANVGPYSQAIAVAGVVSVAGMIGLVPEKMKIWEDNGVEGETVLALQSMIRVGREMNIHGKSGWLGGVGFVLRKEDAGVMKCVWTKWFETRNGREDDSDLEEIDEGYFEASDQNIRSPVLSQAEIPPPLIIVQVSQLPVASHVEFACQGVDSAFLGRLAAAEDDSDESNTLVPAQSSSILHFETNRPEIHAEDLKYQLSSFGRQQLAWGVVAGEREADSLAILMKSIPRLRKEGYKLVSLTVYLNPELWHHADSIIKRLVDAKIEGVCCVPTFGVWWAGDVTKQQREYRVGFAMRSVRI
ncbi:hypothetical protein TWF730_007931 [Orbilia blumenaviensis]|uniref:Diphthine--ammonia ligase n=1 Tax=Orbilia blumenaviensis TaxID=1796055 RepID=A0AAV9V9B2_9PEZI